MRDIAILLVFLSYMCVGALVPFGAALGYVWVDAFYPQAVSYGILRTVPVSLIMALIALLSYAVVDRRAPPRPNLHFALVAAMFIWVTLTATWAVAPAAAWEKWDWAAKMVGFTAFIPFFFRSRVQIEAFLLTYMFAASLNILPVGVKTMFGGGGYGLELGVIGGNSLLSEGSTLATAAIMFAPMLLWAGRHSIVLPEKLRLPGCAGYAGLGCLAAIGTYERTALVALAVLAAGLWLRSRRKVLMIVALLVVGFGLSLATGKAWLDRMQTTTTLASDGGSATTRLAVWAWTLGFVRDHPLGGGFNAYVVDVIHNKADDGEEVVQHGRAFHSSYFEVLGEQGYVGMLLFLALIGRTFLSLQSVKRRARGVAELAWAGTLAGALQLSLLILMSGAAFVGIAFQTMFWYLFAMGECMRQHVRRAEEEGARQAVSEQRRAVAAGAAVGGMVTTRSV